MINRISNQWNNTILNFIITETGFSFVSPSYIIVITRLFSHRNNHTHSCIFNSSYSKYVTVQIQFLSILFTQSFLDHTTLGNFTQYFSKEFSNNRINTVTQIWLFHELNTSTEYGTTPHWNFPKYFINQYFFPKVSLKETSWGWQFT